MAWLPPPYPPVVAEIVGPDPTGDEQAVYDEGYEAGEAAGGGGAVAPVVGQLWPRS